MDEDADYDTENENEDEAEKSNNPQNRLDKKQEKKYSHLESLMLKFIVTACLPFCAVENEYFKKIMKILDPLWIVPSRRFIRSTYHREHGLCCS